MRVLIAGDFSPKFKLQDILRQKNYDSVFNLVIPYIKKSDFSIVNFETTVASEKAFPIKKNGPNLSAPVASIDALRHAGFNVVTLANNHFYDFGMNGVETTLSLLDYAGIHYVGAGRNLEDAQKNLYLEQNNERLAIINCCEHEFSIATKEHGGCNPLDSIRQYHAIREARDKADYVLVIVHGGHELYQLPSTRMQDTYRFFIDVGADAVINHHQHCFSGMEVYKDRPIFYGLGNFLFDTKNKACANVWHDGYMVSLELENGNINFQTIPYRQCAGNLTVMPLKETVELDKFYAEFRRLSDIIANRNRLEENQNNYYKSTSKSTKLAFEPYSGKILNKLYSMNWLPRLMTNRKLLKIRNMIECESHRDKTLFMLRHQDYDKN